MLRSASLPAGMVLTLLALPLPAGAIFGDPSGPGRFPVGVSTLTLTDTTRDRVLVTEVWYPAEATGRDAAARRNRFPLVLVAHGHCGFRTNYEYLTARLAAWGFLVAAPDFPGFNQADCNSPNPPPTGDLAHDPARDLSFLRVTFRDRSGPAARFAPLVRGQHAGTVGHSLGSLAVLNGTIMDPSLSPVIVLAGFTVGDLTTLHPRRPLMVMGGTADTTLPFPAQQALFDSAPAAAFLVKILGGTHSGFTDMDAGLSPEALARQHALVQRYATAFMKRYLRHDLGYGRFLTPADAQAQGTDVQLSTHLP
jgi:predicted dienelactone hydrolase